MEIREVDRADEAALRRFWEIGRAADLATRPYDFYPPWESARSRYQDGRTGFRHEMFGVHAGSGMVGTLFLNLPELDNTHLAFVDVYVHPDHQRRGAGTALVAQAVARARAAGRRSLVGETYAPLGRDSAAMRFARARGFTPALEDAMKIVDLVETEPTWTDIEREVGPRTRDYRLVAWQGRVPDEHVAGVCRLNEAFNEEAPSGDLALEAEVWDEDRIRRAEQQDALSGRCVLAVAALARSGSEGQPGLAKHDGQVEEMVGLTEIVLNRHARNRGFQSGTLVLPAHRGHGLGLAIKVANHRAVREAYPECRVLMTGNAGVNAAMNAVNARLGYRDVERCVEMQRELVGS